MPAAYLTPVAGEKLLIQIGDGATPTEAFAHDCLVNQDRGVSFSAQTTTSDLPDCNDMSAAALRVTRVTAIDLTVTGSGVLRSLSAKTWLDWMASGLPKNVKIRQDLTGVLGGWTITASMILTEFSITGTRADNQTVSLTLKPTGAYAIAANA